MAGSAIGREIRVTAGGGVDLASHVNQQVSVTGQWAGRDAAMTAANGAAPSASAGSPSTGGGDYGATTGGSSAVGRGGSITASSINLVSPNCSGDR